MKYITVTKENKNKNKNLLGSYEVDAIYKGGLPNSFNGVLNQEGGYKNSENHEADGWLDYVSPEYNTETERLGAVFFDDVNNIFTNSVITKTDEEIQSEKLEIAEQEKIQRSQEVAVKKVEDEAQTLDDTDSLENQSLFPFWDEDLDVVIDEKRQSFNAQNELKLYKCVQAHTTQSNWKPKDTPALWTLVAYPNEVPVFVQPTGAQDAYALDDLVHFPTINDPIYKSLIPANVYSPTAYPAGWEVQ